MTKKLLVLVMPALVGSALCTHAAQVKVTMNNVSKTMTLVEKESGKTVDVGTPASSVYELDIPAGTYVLTGIGTDNSTVNGTIEMRVADVSGVQEFKVLTCTAYVTNKHADGTVWTAGGGDYTLDVRVASREGESQVTTVGNSTTAGRQTFLAFNGNSYHATFAPSEPHRAEGYVELYKNGTLTGNVNVSGEMPMAESYTISVPKSATFFLGRKETHFTDFIAVEPSDVKDDGDNTLYTYNLALGQVYNYRTSMTGKLTQAGYFTMSKDAAKRPVIKFTQADYDAMSPTAVNHDVQSNKGYETGDILVNINERGHLRLNAGDTYSAHAMRMWELTDNSTNNYFMEPDFHYTVLGMDGKPSEGIVEITQKEGSAWADIRAVAPGEVMVLVTYDAIGVNYYSNDTKSEYLGGEHWGAIWPENTAVYVISVGQAESAVEPRMFINEEYNKDTMKNSGKNVDAEHDCFYYLDSEEGAYYTFTPQGVADVAIAYPAIGEHMATYTGFTADGVTKNADGSYTLLLKHGRQIVRMTDAGGHAAYQVLTARACHREIVNASRPGSKIYQPGDKITIQYSGLFHPANKVAGIYNMSAYVTYNGVPNGTSLILGKGQYTFGSAASAQAVSVDIPADHDVAASPEIVMDEGVIQVNGFGDPIGNHRVISRTNGRNANFTAVAHKTYFGAIPSVTIPLSAVRNFTINVTSNVEGADIVLSYGGQPLSAGADGSYVGTYGTYTLTAKKAGYRCFRKDFTVGDDADGVQTFGVMLEEAPDAWDGTTQTEPKLEEDGYYVIKAGAELAWYANKVNTSTTAVNARLGADIDLGNYDWTPIGTSSKYFRGTFRGNAHKVTGLYVNNSKAQYQGLFGYMRGASAESPAIVSGVTVSGTVSGKQYVGGVVAYVQDYAVVDTCANYADVTAASSYSGGVAGYIAKTTSKLTNCYNVGTVTGTSNTGGVVGGHLAGVTIANVFSVGAVNSTSTSAGAVIGSTYAKINVSNCFAVSEEAVTAGHTLVSGEQMASGEVAYKLGKAFGQNIGEDPYPVFGGLEVLYDETNDRYYNDTSSVDSIISEGSGDFPVIYYNLQGMPSETPYRGINIVRRADGTVTKAVF